jgi:hypothetical protein
MIWMLDFTQMLIPVRATWALSKECELSIPVPKLGDAMLLDVIAVVSDLQAKKMTYARIVGICGKYTIDDRLARRAWSFASSTVFTYLVCSSKLRVVVTWHEGMPLKRMRVSQSRRDIIRGLCPAVEAPYPRCGSAVEMDVLHYP